MSKRTDKWPTPRYAPPGSGIVLAVFLSPVIWAIITLLVWRW